MVIGLLLACAALAIAIDAARAPVVLIVLLLISTRPLLLAWKAARGTALLPALVWTFLALALAVVAQAVALAEPLASGRPLTERLTYLSVLALLAGLGSVLNARTPGGKAWAILMTVLVLVFLIPWLEDQTRLRRATAIAQLHLDAPWSIFYGLLVLVAVTNYLPTRCGWAAVVLAGLFILEYLALAPLGWPAERRARVWSWIAWLLALCLWLGRYSSRRAPIAHSSCERLWFWFRDAWGVVWALRVLERFNRAAELSRWPVRLTWFGLTAPNAEVGSGPPPTAAATAAATGSTKPLPLPPGEGRGDGLPANSQTRSEFGLGPPPTAAETEAVFRNLMVRFAQPWRLDEVTKTPES